MKVNDNMNHNICRICLSQDLHLFSIYNSPLKSCFEKLTDIELIYSDIQKICYICYARLKQSYILRQQAIIADKLLKEAVHCNREPNELRNFNRLSKSSTININLNPGDSSENKIKIEENGEILQNIQHIALTSQVNIETEDIKESFSDLDNDNADLDNEIKYQLDDEVNAHLDNEIKTNLDEPNVSDSEDDLPLVNISMKKAKEEKVDKVEKVRRYRRQTEVDAKEIILNEEQQKLEMVERSKSENYVNSPYKCDLCFRGFVDPVAFERHKEKHDEKSGPFACALCHLRYSTRKRLRAHADTHARRYACATCTHTARTKHQAKAHEQWHNGHTYPCQPCGRVFTKPTSLLSHARRCSAGVGVGVEEGGSGGERACPLCGDTFSRGHGLLMHMSKSHRFQKQETPSEPESERTCNTCSIVFANTKARVRHLLTSRRHTLYNGDSECSICGVKVLPTMRETHTREHARALRPAPPPATDCATTPLLHCDQCKASFTSRPKLQNHIRRMHLGLKYNKNIVCEICGKKCTSAASLRYHQRRHTGEKPYACASCGRAFARASRLHAHARAHSGERPHACALCPRAFAQRPALTRHLRVHTGAKPYGCHICNKRFSQSNSLHSHVRALHLKIPRSRTRDNRDTSPNPNVSNFTDYVQNRVQ